jgi:hypothetical protein
MVAKIWIEHLTEHTLDLDALLLKNLKKKRSSESVAVSLRALDYARTWSELGSILQTRL